MGKTVTNITSEGIKETRNEKLPQYELIETPGLLALKSYLKIKLQSILTNSGLTILAIMMEETMERFTRINCVSKRNNDFIEKVYHDRSV